MDNFFKGADFLWLIGIISGLVAGIWAFYRFVYEKKLERFKEATTNIFSDNEDQVLAAVANLGVFKKDFLFERNTIDVLLTRLYKELNYDITNAITNALIQFSNRRELLYIASEILAINRNFFYQTNPQQERVRDIRNLFDRVNRLTKNDFIGLNDVYEVELQKPLLDKREALYSEQFLKINERLSYELKWHKQVTANTYARIIRRAAALRMPVSITFLNYVKQLLFNWNLRFYGRKIPLSLYQNDFNNVHLVQFTTSSCCMERSSFGTGLLADIKFNNIKRIYDTDFSNASILDCEFNNGVIYQSFMINTKFTNVTFRNIEFRDIYFPGASFLRCNFINCRGLTAASFYGAFLDQETKLPDQIKNEVGTVDFLTVYDQVQQSRFVAVDKADILKNYAYYISSVKDIFEIYSSNINYKEQFIINAGYTIKLNEIIPPLFASELDESNRIKLLKLLCLDKTLDNLVVELSDAQLTASQISWLPFIKEGISFVQYSDAIHRSNLNASEKSALLNRLQILFSSSIPESTKGFVEEKNTLGKISNPGGGI